MIGHINVSEKKLFAMTPKDNAMVMASASKKVNGWTWNSLIAGTVGRKQFETPLEALQAAAKSLDVSIMRIDT